jgi:DNA invertase Pin-like site-specific DNA recombinase
MKPTKARLPEAPVEPRRCAIYTRTVAGAADNAVSQGAQWAVCTRYLRRQPGWALVADRYDDHGTSGANLDRPALQRLLADVDAAWIDIVLVDDVDRLSRRALHLAAIGERFRAMGVVLVAVAQGLSTADEAGEDWLAWLSEFAELERTLLGTGAR